VSDPEKGKFSADISRKVIEEALESVKNALSTGNEDRPAGPSSVPNPDAAVAETPGEIDELRDQLKLSQEKGRETMSRLQEVHERMLRSVADLENYRKRAQKEKDQMQKFGTEKILSDFLPVLDNLDRALDHGNSSPDFPSLMQGVLMTRKLFEGALAKHGVRPIPAVGHPFDPHIHEAIQQVESADLPPNQVLSELVHGYTLNDRLLRPALVIVSKSPTTSTAATPAVTPETGEPSNAQEEGTREHKP
jgi:molecular chaperone GrpE